MKCERCGIAARECMCEGGSAVAGKAWGEKWYWVRSRSFHVRVWAPGTLYYENNSPPYPPYVVTALPEMNEGTVEGWAHEFEIGPEIIKPAGLAGKS